MDGSSEGMDASSIAPVSSLRSKFENLGKVPSGSSDTNGRSGQLPQSSVSPPVGPKPTNLAGESLQRTTVINDTKDNSGQAAPSDWGGRLGRPVARPSSMISMETTQPAPPLVTVNSPRSPQKSMSVDIRTPNRTDPARPLTPIRTSTSPAIHQARIPAGTTSSAARPHVSPILKPVTLAKYPWDGANAEFDSSKPVSKDARASTPPIVNRASKPKVPAKPPTFSKPAGGLVASKPNIDHTDQSSSPFNTPPGSGSGTPDLQREQMSWPNPQALESTSNSSSTSPHRTEVEPPWVQRLRGDSDASLIGRIRTDSNASFVEPSTLPDNWLPSPVRHTASPQDTHNTVILGPSSTPVKYRPRPNQHPSRTGELPEDRPRLPARPEFQDRTGRASPNNGQMRRMSPDKVREIQSQRSPDRLRRANAEAQPDAPTNAQASKPDKRSALSQGFDRSSSQTQATAAPAPPRLVEHKRREIRPTPSPPVMTDGATAMRKEEPSLPPPSFEPATAPSSDLPEGTRSSRRPPKFKQRPWQVATGYETRLFAICGEFICTSGFVTKAWNLKTGEQLLHLENRENIRVTSLVFKPLANVDDEGKRIWLGTNVGDILEVDIPSQKVVKSKNTAHPRREIIRMYRYASEIWTLDEAGELYVWKPDHKGMPSLDSQNIKRRVPRGHSFSLACGPQLWLACGKDIRVFEPSAPLDTDFQLIVNPLSQSGVGDVTSGTAVSSKPDLIYFGHSDGKVSVYNRRDFTCVAVTSVSLYKISCLVGVGDYLWAGYGTGMAYVYDVSTSPWTIKKDWKAHEKQISGIIVDPSAMWKMDRLNVVSLGADNHLRIWDGMLADDWIDAHMQEHDVEYCSFREMSAAVMTWNAGASTPYSLQHSSEDHNFFLDYISAQDAPDLLVFGFQELVDLEDKKLTAKSLFKSKRKDAGDQEHMSHQYRVWRDHLVACVDRCKPGNQSYTMLTCSSMVGLFTCVFVKSSQRSRVRAVHTAEVKRGMGGLHGNKGALIVRLVVDDSSVCFVNCHLAAGQTQTLNRNNDAAAILESSELPAYPLGEGGGGNSSSSSSSSSSLHGDVFVSGGDASMILDHEICILHGDLNYRIDTMGRDTVVKLVHQGQLAKLLDRDQLLLSRKRNPAFRLRAFHENPISFAPTYKYDVHSDTYDTSEKRRPPAWCDRILYRGLGRVMMDEYRRWDQIRVSDHRPVSGRFRIRVKTIYPAQRAKTHSQCLREFEKVRGRIAQAVQLDYLTNVLGVAQRDALAALAK